MSGRALPGVPRERGLAVAYERWCFYRLLAQWAKEYRVESALEGPLDGIDGVHGVHCVGLARAGVRVVASVADDASAQSARAVYASAAPEQSVDVRVTDRAHLAALPASDLVLIYRSLPLVGDWKSYLRSMAKMARTVLVVATPNPDNWRQAAVGLIRRRPALDACRTETLAPVLWEIGRVREHVYFDAPWWPASPFEKSRAGILRRAAQLHAFVIDMRPRTPQARRRLALAGARAPA